MLSPMCAAVPGSAEAPYADGPARHVSDMDIDHPSIGHDDLAPAAPGQGIPASALPSQELLAKLQAFSEGAMQPAQPHTSHLQACPPRALRPTCSTLMPAEAIAVTPPPCMSWADANQTVSPCIRLLLEAS